MGDVSCGAVITEAHPIVQVNKLRAGQAPGFVLEKIRHGVVGHEQCRGGKVQVDEALKQGWVLGVNRKNASVRRTAKPIFNDFDIS